MQRTDWWLPEARGVQGGWVKTGEGGQKVQTSSYKITHGDVTYSMVTKGNNTMSYI